MICHKLGDFLALNAFSPLAPSSARLCLGVSLFWLVIRGFSLLLFDVYRSVLFFDCSDWFLFCWRAPTLDVNTLLCVLLAPLPLFFCPLRLLMLRPSVFSFVACNLVVFSFVVAGVAVCFVPFLWWVCSSFFRSSAC